MLANTTHLKGLVIRATDGEIGTVDQLYSTTSHGQSDMSRLRPAAGCRTGRS